MSTVPKNSETSAAAGIFGTQRRRVWGLAYRLTGSAEDADDIVQETFTRLIERSPPDDRALEAWLMQVAVRLGIDAVRSRRRRSYPGPWLPAAVEASDEDWLDSFASNDPDPETRYGLLESATLAFLLALEALGPRQRAVLLLRDVLGRSAAETAELLDTSEGNIRVLHLRARRAMDRYDSTRCAPTAELRARHQDVLERFLTCLASQDTAGLEAMLTEAVRTETDAGGAYSALAAAMEGRARVARFYLRAALNRAAGGALLETRMVNGMPAALMNPHPPRSPASATHCPGHRRGRRWPHPRDPNDSGPRKARRGTLSRRDGNHAVEALIYACGANAPAKRQRGQPTRDDAMAPSVTGPRRNGSASSPAVVCSRAASRSRTPQVTDVPSSAGVHVAKSLSNNEKQLPKFVS